MMPRSMREHDKVEREIDIDENAEPRWQWRRAIGPRNRRSRARA